MSKKTTSTVIQQFTIPGAIVQECEARLVALLSIYTGDAPPNGTANFIKFVKQDNLICTLSSNKTA